MKAGGGASRPRVSHNQGSIYGACRGCRRCLDGREYPRSPRIARARTPGRGAWNDVLRACASCLCRCSARGPRSARGMAKQRRAGMRGSAGGQGGRPAFTGRECANGVRGATQLAAEGKSRVQACADGAAGLGASCVLNDARGDARTALCNALALTATLSPRDVARWWSPWGSGRASARRRKHASQRMGSHS